MTLQQAVNLIKNKTISSDTKSVWADLGCGSGIFTYALAGLLNKESKIYAIDKNISKLKINLQANEALIEPVELDFEKTALPFNNLDGVLMANSLHFVKEKISFLEKIIHCLHKNGRFLIVEYDKEVANHWVPYPINFLSLKKIFNVVGYSSVTKINERPSAFNSENLYSAIVETNQTGTVRL